MEKITIENKSCIFLDHGKQIQNLYKQYAEPNTKSYSLKQEIFNFQPKPIHHPSETALNSGQSKSLHRKRKAETGNNADLKENAYLKEFIKEVQQKYLNSSQIGDDLPRFWDEEHEFPQFRGANPTKEYQITRFGQHDYIIPPKTKFFNYNIENLSLLLPELETYDLLIMDMPWQNKYIRRLKRVKTSLAYQMLDNDTLQKMPISQLIHTNSLVVLWCTNAQQHRKAIEEVFLPKWGLQLVHRLKWFKINTLGDLISPPKAEGHKQPYELLYLACPTERNVLDLNELSRVDFLMSIPSIIHSHKPPLIEWLKKFLPCSENFKGLEIFARYLQPQFTSIGLEVLKLMDKRLYDEIQHSE